MLMHSSLDRSLVRGWLAARSIARGLPAPVDDQDGWRVDTGQPTEARRYVFTEVTDGLRRIALSESSPLIVLKLCGTAAAMRSAVPSHWLINEAGYFMTSDQTPSSQLALPPGYELEVSAHDPSIVARIFDRCGDLAASGFAASSDGVFVFDRISTEAAHRRRGLASAIMKALGARRLPGDRQALVATDEGRSLYATLGWAVRSPWTTAVIGSA